MSFQARLVKVIKEDSPELIELAHWLNHLNFFNEGQIHWLLAQIKEEIHSISKLAISDARYVSIDKKLEFFDVENFDIISDTSLINEIVENTITLVVCNCNALQRTLHPFETQDTSGV